MSDRYPGYDVLAKRNSPSWNTRTQTVVDRRLAMDPRARNFFNEREWGTLQAICHRIIPQPASRKTPAAIAAMIDAKLASNATDGYRDARLPPMGEAWRRGLAALDAQALDRHGRKFGDLSPSEQDGLLSAAQQGLDPHESWGDMPPPVFFKKRLLFDIVAAYYAHPAAWSEIGFGGPAAPRGYVRMSYDRRDPWEAAEAKPGEEEKARRENLRVGRR